MRRNWIKTGMATGLLTVGALPAAILYEKDGIALEGTVRLVGRNAATCQVLEENETPETYDATKANHGRPLHVWRLDYGALNASGKALSNLTAHFQIEAEWPPCTNWTGLGQYPGPVQWAGSFETIQRTAGLEVGGEARETVYVLAIDGQQPLFRNWQLDFRFGETTAKAEEVLRPIAPPPEPEPRLPPQPACVGPQDGAECWIEVTNHPRCYLWNDGYTPDEPVSWSGVCLDNRASGRGTVTGTPVRFAEFPCGSEVGCPPYQSRGAYQTGKKQGRWIERHAANLVSEGPYVDGKRHGHWIDRFSAGDVSQGPYVNGEMHGEWVWQDTDGSGARTQWVNGEEKGTKWFDQ